MSMFIGVTGSTGSGKSMVARELLNQGAIVLNADIAAREALLPESPIVPKVIEAMGKEIELVQGIIDRKALAGLVFKNPDKLKKLNAIMHPYIREQMLSNAQTAMRIYSDRKAVVFDAPLLIEAGMKDDMDEIWLVEAPLEARIMRLKKRDRLETDDIMARISSRVPDSELEKYADVIIDNSGSLRDLISTTARLFAERILAKK